MTRKDLLDIIEYVLEVINNLYSKRPSEEEKKEPGDKKKETGKWADDLDEWADELDMAQNQLAKSIIQENDAEYLKLTEELGAVISGIRKDLIELENVRDIVGGVKGAVGLITQIVTLLGA